MRFYERNWFLWLSLFLFAPLGIFILWRYHEEKHVAFKAILTILFAAIFVCGVVFSIKSVTGHHDKKPAVKTEEEAKEEKPKKEEEAGKTLTFNMDSMSIIEGEAMSVVINNIDETEGVTWTIEDPNTAYIESSNGNRCTVVGYLEGQTILHAKSSDGAGSLAVTVKPAKKKASASVEESIISMAEKSSTTTGTNLKYDVHVEKDFSAIEFDYWFEGFSGEDVVELTGASSVEQAVEKISKDYYTKIKEILENYDKDPSKTTVTIKFLNGTSDEKGYTGESGRQVTNEVLFTTVDGNAVNNVTE